MNKSFKKLKYKNKNMSISKIKIYFSLIAIIFCINISQTNAIEYVYSDAIKTKVIDKNLHHLEIIVN